MNIYWSIGLFLVTALGSWHISARYHEAAWAHEKAGMLASSETLGKNEAKKANVASDTAEKVNAKDRVVYKTITQSVDKIVDRPIYRNICLDADGLREANSALARTLPDTGKPNAAMPVVRTVGGWLWSVRLAENR